MTHVNIPPVGWLHVQPAGMCASSEAESAAQCDAYRARASGIPGLEVARAPVLLDHPLPQRARALVGVLLGVGELGDEVGGTDGPAEPEAGREDLGERARLQDDVGPERPQRRQRVPSKDSSR